MKATSLFQQVTTVEPPVSDHPKCQVEVVAYEILDHNGSTFFLIRAHAPMPMQCFVHEKVNFEKKNPILPFEKFPFLVLARNTMMLPHLIIHSSLHYLSTGRLRFKLVADKS